ncbi:MAG: 2-oxo acid dehydrogenase subunit E2, partial [Deltaproteobacteria bacterium]|nr:2-oxo acid dehydrogenase subunit E2 [Deltaproteobacteria bacterium]
YLPPGAIVGFGAITKKPVVVDDAITIRPIMLLSVTVDHRFITGAVSARFRQRLKALLEDPKRAVLEMA